WDGKRDMSDGWYGFNNYFDMLASNQVPHTAMLVTKMKFDTEAAFPKILFARDKWLTNEEIEKIIPIVHSDKVKDLISKNWTPNGVDGERVAALPPPEEDIGPSAAELEAA